MNQHLKQAIAAARAGKEPQAKVLLARVIKDEPENVNAWFLLSTLADTEEQKIQHLEKVLGLQPEHPTARQQLAELVPSPPTPVEEDLPDISEEDEEPTPDMFPLPDVDEAPSEIPDDPEEAMAWLERLAADQGAPMDELPSMMAQTVIDVPDFDTAELENDLDDVQPLEEVFAEEAVEDEAPEDPDEAMAWLEQLAAEQGAPLDELPTMLDDEEEAEEDSFSWLDDAFEEEEEPDYLDATPTLISQQDEDTESEDYPESDTAKTLAVSDDSFDFVSQSQGDSIPSWLVGDEEFISADTLLTGSPEEIEEEAEPDNLPDWLNEMPADDWEGEEGKKSGQVVWKAGEGDENLKPVPPAAKKEAKAAVKKTAAPKDNSIYIGILVVLAIILLLAILYLFFF